MRVFTARRVDVGRGRVRVSVRVLEREVRLFTPDHSHPHTNLTPTDVNTPCRKTLARLVNEQRLSGTDKTLNFIQHAQRCSRLGYEADNGAAGCLRLFVEEGVCGKNDNLNVCGARIRL